MSHGVFVVPLTMPRRLTSKISLGDEPQRVPLTRVALYMRVLSHTVRCITLSHYPKNPIITGRKLFEQLIIAILLIIR